MLQAGIGGYVLRGLRQFPIAQRAQQVARQNHALTTPLGQPLFGEKVGALLHRLLGLATKAQVAQARATADQLLVEPGGPRSEEHTSELQSLLRITESVLC